MPKTRTIESQVLRVENGFAIVKSWCKKVRDDGMVYGHVNIWYDVCAIKDGELGDCFESFKSFGKAVKCLDEMV